MKIKAILTCLGILMLSAISATIGVTYAYTNSSISQFCYPCPAPFNLQIRDQDETWGEGVSDTWTTSNMTPGENFEFSGKFIGFRANQKGSLAISCQYRVLEETPVSKADTDPFTFQYPDRMARELIITRFLYLNNLWQIDCLTGNASGIRGGEIQAYLRNRDRSWQIMDADNDGKLTLVDLKRIPLKGLPLLIQKNAGETRLLLSLRFAETAGNELQGDVLIFNMFYTFTSY